VVIFGILRLEKSFLSVEKSVKILLITPLFVNSDVEKVLTYGTIGLFVDFRIGGGSPIDFFAKVLADGTMGYV